MLAHRCKGASRTANLVTRRVPATASGLTFRPGRSVVTTILCKFTEIVSQELKGAVASSDNPIERSSRPSGEGSSLCPDRSYA
jgi:hypothetical protein